MSGLGAVGRGRGTVSGADADADSNGDGDGDGAADKAVDGGGTDGRDAAPGRAAGDGAAGDRGVPAGGDVLVALEHAAVRFGAVQALHATTLAVRRGEFVALVGANGAGKTTLLRTLHGLLRLQQGQRVGALPASAQAMVFQRPFLLRLSAAANLALALWLAGVPRAERAARADTALARVGLQGLQRRPARALSGGQQQRLALARAWAVRPRLLFLDEPTASLDPAAKKDVEVLLAGFAAEGMTVVMSTHNLGQAKRLATRVVHVEAGRVHDDLPTAAFFGGGAGARAQAFLDGETA